ncbi:hypothetical protein RvY_10690 [Ramazzottius varieornatus]|uniref:Uncharacterized protein n=1 Tax=Ramazzottius varieornatus TaxID=947166 RepID=A0A1D1VDK1_RAMVA|nr:hypothetical protein RvY_10690 [Ramazzottius varieornatus]
MDPWTSLAQEGYMAIAAHWVTNEFELRRVLLDFVDLPAEHSAENLKNCSDSLLLDPCIKRSLVPDTVGKLAASDLLKKFCAFYKTESDQIPKSTAVTSVSTSTIRRVFLELLNKNASAD